MTIPRKLIKNMPYTVTKLTDYTEASFDRAASELLEHLRAESDAVESEETWKLFRDRWMGRKNGISKQLRELWLNLAPAGVKPRVGVIYRDLELQIQDAVATQKEKYEAIVILRKAASDIFLDVTLPGIRRPIGAEHPVIKTMNEIIGVFRNLGYSVEEGPESRNRLLQLRGAGTLPPNHPAREHAGHAVLSPGEESEDRCPTACSLRTTYFAECRFGRCRR